MAKLKKKRKSVNYKKKYTHMAALMLVALRLGATINPALRMRGLPCFPVKRLVAAFKEIHKGVE